MSLESMPKPACALEAEPSKTSHHAALWRPLPGACALRASQRFTCGERLPSADPLADFRCTFGGFRSS